MNAVSTPGDQQDLGARIGRLANLLSSDRFPSADRAALKRHAPGSPPTMAFYRLWLRYLDEELPDEHQTQEWALIAWGLCILGPQAHRPDQPLGRVLADQGYSEIRLERLLAADPDVNLDLVASMVRFLASKGTGFNWLDAAALLLTRDTERREAVNRRIATTYYRSLQTKQES